jgi:hypothetical protein
MSTREQLETTARTVVAADTAQLRDALGRVQWRRRGFLQRLTQDPAASADAAAGSRR